MPPGLTSPVHVGVIIVVALIVLGPDKLPQALRQVGRTMAEVRRWSDSISSEMRDVLSIDAETQPAATPAPLAPVPMQAGNGNGQSAAPAAPAAPAPGRASGSLPEEWSTELSVHPALREGGEWN